MSISKTIVFFGTDDFSAISLQRLITDGYPIGAVVTKPDSRRGRGQELIAPIVKTIALENHIPVWQPETLAAIIPKVQSLGTSIGVLVSFGKIIPQAIIDLFSPGIVNVHPSLLPKYRGPSPVETALLNGDHETGVSIMQLTAAMDAGPVYDQTTLPLHGTETAPDLEQTLGELGAERLSAILPSIIDGSLQPVPQNDSDATYCSLLQKSDAVLDPSSVTAIEAERRIRAYLTFPKTKLTVLGQPIVITKAHISDVAVTPLDIPCKEGVLSIDELIGPSGRIMDKKAFLNGYDK